MRRISHSPPREEEEKEKHNFEYNRTTLKQDSPTKNFPVKENMESVDSSKSPVKPMQIQIHRKLCKAQANMFVQVVSSKHWNDTRTRLTIQKLKQEDLLLFLKNLKKSFIF